MLASSLLGMLWIGATNEHRVRIDPGLVRCPAVLALRSGDPAHFAIRHGDRFDGGPPGCTADPGHTVSSGGRCGGYDVRAGLRLHWPQGFDIAAVAREHR